jgi:Fe-S cluster assembly protein SufD
MNTLKGINAVIQAKDHYTAEFERLASRLAGQSAPWLRELRSAAIARFAERGFPTPRDEDWKYTRTAVLEKRAFDCEAVDGAVDMDKINALLQAESAAPRLVFINGRYFPALSRIDDLPAGVTLAGLNAVLHTKPDALKGLFGAVALLERHPFAALNAAFADDGVYLSIAGGTILEQPLHAVFITTAAQDGRAAHPRILVRAGDNSRATLVERYIALDDAMYPLGREYFTNTTVEIKLGNNADLDHYRVQEEGAKAFHVSGVHVLQGRDSRYTGHGVSLGNALLRNDIDMQLAADGAHCDLTGLYLVSGRQHVDIHTRIDHLQPHGTSNEFYKGILDGHGRGVFNGKVIVHPDAQKTDARQVNNNLLLSDNAEADTKPQLEIYADDVKCSHGATVGQLDADAVFYLRSRGVDEAAARHLLTHAFAAEIIEQVEPAALRAYLDTAVMARLPQGAQSEGSP